VRAAWKQGDNAARQVSQMNVAKTGQKTQKPNSKTRALVQTEIRGKKENCPDPNSWGRRDDGPKRDFSAKTERRKQKVDLLPMAAEEKMEVLTGGWKERTAKSLQNAMPQKTAEKKRKHGKFWARRAREEVMEWI